MAHFDIFFCREALPSPHTRPHWEGIPPPGFHSLDDFGISRSSVSAAEILQIALWGQPLVPDILDQIETVPWKKPIFNRFSLVAPEPKHIAKKV